MKEAFLKSRVGCGAIRVDNESMMELMVAEE
jgi:hypothetical protein